MKFYIISLSLLLTVSGSWATFPFHYFSFGLQAPPLLPPPPAQFFYPAPERNLPHQQLLFYPEQREFFPDIYQPLNYFPAAPPYNPYNAPPAQRYPFYPENPDSYDPVVQYIHRQPPLKASPSYPGKLDIVAQPILKDYEKVANEPEKINEQSEKIVDRISVQVTTNPREPQIETTSMKSVHQEVTTLKNSETETTSMNYIQPEVTTRSKNLNIEAVSTKSVQPEVTTHSEIETTSMMSMQSEVTTNSTNFEMETTPMESQQPQEAENIIVESADDPEKEEKEEMTGEPTTIGWMFID